MIIGSQGWKFSHEDIVTWTHIYYQILAMDLITSRALSQRQVNHINNCVWKTVKHIGVSMEAKDDDFDNNMFYTPPSYPLEPIYVELEAHMVVDHGKRLHAFCWIII
jgi:hypothetical protein